MQSQLEGVGPAVESHTVLDAAKGAERSLEGLHRLSADETILPDDMQEAIVSGLQRVRVDDEVESDEMTSLSSAAEALRLTAAAPPRNQNLGGDYD